MILNLAYQLTHFQDATDAPDNDVKEYHEIDHTVKENEYGPLAK